MSEVVWVALGSGILLGAALTILGLRMHRDLIYKRALWGDTSFLCSEDISLAYLIVQADSGALPPDRQLSDELSAVRDRLARLENVVFIGKEQGGDEHQEG